MEMELKWNILIGAELGATIPDVTWIRKVLKNGDSYFIGKIKAVFAGDKVTISQLSNTIIKIRFTDTTIWKGQFRDFTINLNKRIELNDDSPYSE
jgi:hypothetical protein